MLYFFAICLPYPASYWCVWLATGCGVLLLFLGAWGGQRGEIYQHFKILPSFGGCYGFQKKCVFWGKTKSAGEISAGFLGFEASTKVVSSLIFEPSWNNWLIPLVGKFREISSSIISMYSWKFLHCPTKGHPVHGLHVPPWKLTYPLKMDAWKIIHFLLKWSFFETFVHFFFGIRLVFCWITFYRNHGNSGKLICCCISLLNDHCLVGIEL